MEAAESNSWCEIDSSENGSALAAWLCEQYTDQAGREEDRLHVVVDVLQAAGEGEFAQARFEQVLASYAGEDFPDFKRVGRDWIAVDGTDDLAPSRVSDWEKFCKQHVFHEGEIWVKNATGYTFYFFDRHKW
ncbi:hypothetical protein ACIQC7_35085 [Kitasatospora sp. NPDC088556]|uniref:hypothetical protein n=1 Tax=Kitasatospora sp. NPDC088556 TaxID=3364076 RepID=UPI0037FC157F